MMFALNCEAKPWVDLYRLKKANAEPFSLYVSSDTNVELIITGIGDIAMASAVGWIGAQSPRRQRVWLNIGTAGHASYALGTVLQVHGVANSAQGRAHYPPLTAKWEQGTAALLSVAAPTENYPEGAMVDMEAAAFFSAAMRFSSSELVQAVKVISDNSEHGLDELNADRITELMSEHTLELDRYAKNLVALVSDVQWFNELEYLLAVKTTHSQRQQLSILLRKATALGLSDQVRAIGIDTSMSFETAHRMINDLVESVVPDLKSAS